MVDIWLGIAFFCFVLFVYVKARKLAIGFFNNEILKIQREFSDLESLKQEIEELKKSTLQKLEEIPKKKERLLQESQKSTASVITQKKEDLKSLKAAKISSIQNFLELAYKRKTIAVKKEILQSTRQILIEKLSNEKTDNSSLLEVFHLLKRLSN